MSQVGTKRNQLPELFLEVIKAGLATVLSMQGIQAGQATRTSQAIRFVFSSRTGLEWSGGLELRISLILIKITVPVQC